MTKETIFERMNALYRQKIPYFFLLSFDMTKGDIVALDALKPNNIFLQTGHYSALPAFAPVEKPLHWQVKPISKSDYQKQFLQVKQEIHKGNTYLLNLTCEAAVTCNYTLSEIFKTSTARYKLLYKDEFVHFSPEPFVTIRDNHIATYPMKGTIDAASEGAKESILADNKELHEQYTIVDLMRNDLSMVAKKVRVQKFRYLEKIITQQKKLYTVSSAITGKLRKEYIAAPGNIFKKLLPAGSVTGAPKQSTVAIIKQVESHNRNFYTGVWGIFDGKSIDSCVIIRYIEKRNGNLFYKSGGGITAESICEKEYQEIKDKIYVALH